MAKRKVTRGEEKKEGDPRKFVRRVRAQQQKLGERAWRRLVKAGATDVGVTLTAADRDAVRRLALNHPTEATQYLRRKYAGLGLKEATEAVFAIAPSARKRVTTSWKRKSKSKKKAARARPREAP